MSREEVRTLLPPIRLLVTLTLILTLNTALIHDVQAGATANGVPQNTPYVFPPYIDVSYSQSGISYFDHKDGPLITLWRQGITDARDRRFVFEWPSGKLSNIEYKFRPRDRITREQFYALVARAFGLEPTWGPSPFSDYNAATASKNYAEWFVDYPQPSLTQATITASGTGTLSLLAVRSESYGPVWESVWRASMDSQPETVFTVNLPTNTRGIVLYRSTTTQQIDAEIVRVTDNNGDTRYVHAKIPAGKDSTDIIGDVDDTYYPWVMAAVDEGLVDTGSGMFNPSSYVTYEEIIATLIRAMGLEQVAQSLNTDMVNGLTNISRYSYFQSSAALKPYLALWRLAVDMPDVGEWANDAGGPRQYATRAMATNLIYRATRWLDMFVEWTEDGRIRLTATPRWKWRPVYRYARVVDGRYVPYEFVETINELQIYYAYPRSQDGYCAGCIRFLGELQSVEYAPWWGTAPVPTTDTFVATWIPNRTVWGEELQLPQEGLFVAGILRAGVYDPYHFPEPLGHLYRAWARMNTQSFATVQFPDGHVTHEHPFGWSYSCHVPHQYVVECPRSPFYPFRLIQREMSASLSPTSAMPGQSVVIRGRTEQPVARMIADVPTPSGERKQIRLERVWKGENEERWEGSWVVDQDLQPGDYEITVTAFYADAAVPRRAKVVLTVVQPPPISPHCDVMVDPIWASRGESVTVGCTDVTEGGRVVGGTIAILGYGSYSLSNVSDNVWSAQVQAPMSEGVYNVVYNLIAEDEVGIQHQFQEYQLLVVAPPGSQPPGIGAPGGGLEIRDSVTGGRVRLTR